MFVKIFVKFVLLFILNEFKFKYINSLQFWNALSNEVKFKGEISGKFKYFNFLQLLNKNCICVTLETSKFDILIDINDLQ